MQDVVHFGLLMPHRFMPPFVCILAQAVLGNSVSETAAGNANTHGFVSSGMPSTLITKALEKLNLETPQP